MSWEESPSVRRRWPPLVIVLLVVVVIAAVVVTRPEASDLEVAPEDPRNEGARVDSGPVPDRLRLVSEPPQTALTGTGPLLDGVTAMTIVAADFASRVVLIDAATGDIRTRSVFSGATQARPTAVRAVGDAVILDAENQVVRIADDGDGDTLTLAGERESVPTASDQAVWVHRRSGPTGPPTATLLDIVGGRVRAELRLPTLAVPLAGSDDALIVGLPDSVARIGVDGETNEVANGQALATDGEHLARVECDGVDCAIVTGTIDDPDQVRITLRERDEPIGLYADLRGTSSPQTSVAVPPRGSFSPDGRLLALPLVTRLRDGRIDDANLVVIDTTLRSEVARLPGSTLTKPDTPHGWSADSAYLVASAGPSLTVWEAATGRIDRLPVSVPPIYAMTVR